MKAGISTACFYPKLTEDALRAIAEHHVGATEIFFNAPSELEDSFVQALAHTAWAHHVEVLAVHPYLSGFEPFLLFSNYSRRTQDGFVTYQRFFDAANRLGAQIVVMHGGRRDHPQGLAHYFDIYGELAELARRQGVTLAQENVPRCISHDPAFFTEMSRYLPDSRYVLDVKQALREGCDPLEMACAMGSRLCHLHLSDHTADNDCVLVGNGVMDTADFLDRLWQETGFDGGAVLEVYRCAYREEKELFDSYQKIRSAVKVAEQRRVLP